MVGGDGIPLRAEELAATLSELLTWAQEHAPRREPPIRVRLSEHLDSELSELPVVSSALAGYDRVNFQVALDAFLEGEERSAELIGLSTMHGYRFGLAELGQPASRFSPLPDPGPAEYETVEVGERAVTCVATGLWLIRAGDARLALLLSRSEHGPGEADLGLEVMASERDTAEGLLATLTHLMDEHNVYRGRVVAIEGSPYGGIGLSVRPLPDVARDRIVLPTGVLERVERHTERFSAHAEALRSAGRHLRRGLLLHGPPGTGKTLTAMYLASLMPERTTLLLTGQALALIGAATEIARKLAPAMIVLEDVDLVAMDRGMYGNANPVLFELLNAMDGLAEDMDVIFLLTTNRADALEAALAARPGRVDLALELPLPDAEARARLLDLYGEGLDLAIENQDEVVEATAGTTPAFIRELLRRSALLAAESGDGMRITDARIAAALGELREAGGELTERLLGGQGQAPPGMHGPGFADGPGLMDIELDE